MNKPLFQLILDLMDKVLGWLGLSKTEFVGLMIALLPLLMHFKVITPEQADWIMTVLIGTGVIAGRDALRKIQHPAASEPSRK